MGITLSKAALEAVLERAMRDARAPHYPVDWTWADRIRWLSAEIAGGDAKGKTYVAATGGALLAKATNPQVDTLTQKADGGQRGYGLRGVTELFQERVRGTVHLGTLSKWPLNNAPFNRGPARIERFVVAGYLMPVYEEYKSWMTELDTYTAERAFNALVAFLRVRMDAQLAEDRAAASSPRMAAARSTADLLEAVQLWLTEDPEEGARGQALVAAVLDLVWDDIEVVPKHHPAPFDVKRDGDPPPLVCECKQQVINEGDVLELARRAAHHGVDLALYAALATGQSPLPVDRIRVIALERHGTLLDVVHDTHELVVHVCVHAGIKAGDIAGELPQALADRCARAGVSTRGVARLRELIASAGAQQG